MSSLTVCAQALQAWIAHCDEKGLPCEPALDLAGGADRRVVPLPHFVAILEDIAAGAGHATLGWDVGEGYDFGRLGVVGSAIRSSSTLGAALQRFIDYFGIVQDASEFDIRRDGAAVAVSYRILDPEIWPRRQDALFTLSIIARLLRWAVGFRWEDVQIALESEDPAVAAALCRATRIACSAGAETNSLRFPAAFLELPIRPGAAVVPPDYRMLNRSMAQKRRAMSIGLRVQSAVYRHLGSPEVDQERIAQELGMSTRTLRRRLAEENSSFQQIVYGCRMRHAAQQFRLRPDVSIAELALRLGYSEHSAFTRAFSRWSGVSPHAYVKEERRTAVG